MLVGIETDRGPWVQALVAAGYVVYRDQPAAGGPLPGTALHVGGEVRCRRMRICWPRSSGWTGRITARSPGTREIAEHVKIAARAHQTMIWSRVRQVNTLRSLLREYYPAALAAFGTDLAEPGRAGGAGRRTDPGAGPTADPSPDRNAAAQGRPATQPRRDRSQDPGRVEHPSS